MTTPPSHPPGAGPAPVRRISVVGNSGSGKTTFAREVALRLGVPHLELDSVFHQPGWTPLPDEDFRRRVADFTVAGAWVVDGNYSQVRDIVWQRADTVVWLDLDRSHVMRQILWRTARRGVRRTELWNGNRESLRNALSRDPDISVVRWAWQQHAANRERFAAAMADPRWARLRFVRVTSRGAAQAWLASLTSAAGPAPGGNVEA